jgi:hypothetical protein
MTEQDRVTPNMIGRVSIDLDVDVLTIRADVTGPSGATVEVEFQDPDTIAAVLGALFATDTGTAREKVATALVANYEAECHMYQSVF